MGKCTPAAFFILLLAVSPALGQSTVLVELGSSMKYLENGSMPGIGLDWIAKDYPNTWPTGTYGVGYGAGDLVQTPVANGTVSVYTRAEFTIADVSQVQTLFLGADFDDGYIAWINGTEVYRSPQMPAGDPPWSTGVGLHESSNGLPPDYGALINVSEPGIPVLENGTNVLAVGVWNAPLPSSDLVVVPQLVMNLPGPDARGPYLQMGTPTSVVMRWRTSTLSDSRVQYGPASDDLSTTVDDPAPVMDHEVTLTDLTPDTEYFYSVGSSTEVIAGGDADHFFRTSPPPGTRRPIRVWVLGDSGTANANARAVRDAYKTFTANVPTDLWLMLGDNAYPNGTDDEYQAAVFETYPEMLRTSVLWTTLGNHDAVSASSATELGPYYDSFSLPAAAEAGGIVSGTEAYYSFDFGNIHFICLNSHDVDRSPGGAMLTWLQADLMNTVQDWVIAFWHHPPYSKGSHNSDDPLDSQGRLTDMRQDVLPVLEAWGVDLVLSGHSHSYERSFLLDGHYGLSGTITEAMKLDDGDGRVDGGGAYQKSTAGPAPHEGAVYIVAGSSGLINPVSQHLAMYVWLSELGSVVLDSEGDRLLARFLNDQGVVRDHFTLVKDTGVAPLADFSASITAGPAPLAVQFTDLSTTNTAAWSWDFENDATADSTQQHPSHVYTTSGIYSVSLDASNQTGSDPEVKTGFICVSEGVPGAAAGLIIDPDKRSLSWDILAAAEHYDVVKGDLGPLVSSGGDFVAANLECLENNVAGRQADDPARPLAGSAFFYLVRGASLCDEQGTYDSGGPGQVTSRDAGIDAAIQSCP